jgi:hypothetical protein
VKLALLGAARTECCEYQNGREKAFRLASGSSIVVRPSCISNQRESIQPMNTKGVAGSALIIVVLISAQALGGVLQNQGSPVPSWPRQPDIERSAPMQSNEQVMAAQSSSGQPETPQSDSHQVAGPLREAAGVTEFFHEQIGNRESAGTPLLASGPDFNRETFCKNKLELGLEVGVLPINTPMLVGPIFGYSLHRPHKGYAAFYTLVPTMASLRWQLYNPGGPSFLRGNTELTFGGTYTAITEGPESVFAGPLIGARYNFVQPNWKLVPYADLRFGLGYTDAQGPYEVMHHLRDVGQGQDFTFTFVMSAGLRYNFSPRYSASLAFMAMHISNLYLSEPEYINHGVNVVGPMVGFNVGLNGLLRRTKG